MDGRVQRDVGGLERPADAGVRRLPRGRTGQSCAPTAGCSGPPPTAGTRRRSRWRPGYCTLSILFSDWQRTGRRDLRMTNDRHYYRDGTEQLWRMAPGEVPRPYTEAEGWRPLQIWGMGIASQDLTGDGRPEVFLTSQGDNKLQTLADGATGTDVRGHRAGARRHGPSPVRRRRRPPVDGVARRVPGRQQRRPRRPVRVEGQRRGGARVRHP